MDDVNRFAYLRNKLTLSYQDLIGDKKSGFKIKLQEVEQKNYAPAGKFLVQTKTKTHKIKLTFLDNLNKFLFLQVFSIRTFLLVYTIKKQKEYYKT